ncbi:hypothetical protein GCM10009839_45330 [Catenulispora yoronensis]|uniref:Uncharacterized protein n=1 Tax=Catenulispora yoronensis TaxID=450799 RepID=A0ABN2UL40_9ACTN
MGENGKRGRAKSDRDEGGWGRAAVVAACTGALVQLARLVVSMLR